MPRSSGTQPRPRRARACAGPGARRRCRRARPALSTCRCRPMTAPQQRGLAGAVAPDQRDDLAVADGQVDLAQGLGLAVPGGQPPDLERSVGSAMVARHPPAQVGRDDPLVGAHLRRRGPRRARPRTAARSPGRRASRRRACCGRRARRCARSATRLTRAMVRSTSSTPMPAVGSSSSSSRGSSASARASSRARFWPYARSPASTPARSASPTCSSRSIGARAEPAHLLLGAPEPVARAPVGEARASSTWSTSGHLVEQAGDLERARHAEVDDLLRAEPGDVLVAEVDRARGGGEEAGEQVEQRGLAGAVGPDEGVHAALGDVRSTWSTALKPRNSLVRPTLRRATRAVEVTGPFPISMLLDAGVRCRPGSRSPLCERSHVRRHPVDSDNWRRGSGNLSAESGRCRWRKVQRRA